MKKAIALVVVMMFAAVLFVGCAPTTEKKAETTVATTEASAATVEAKTVTATKEVVSPVSKTEKKAVKKAI